eukprot:3148066-Prymnesium_polylepis.2
MSRHTCAPSPETCPPKLAPSSDLARKPPRCVLHTPRGPSSRLVLSTVPKAVGDGVRSATGRHVVANGTPPTDHG